MKYNMNNEFSYWMGVAVFLFLSYYSISQNNSSLIYVLAENSDKLPLTTDMIKVDGEPDQIYINANTNLSYVVSTLSNSISIINLTENYVTDVIKNRNLNSMPTKIMAINPNTNRIYLIEDPMEDKHVISVIDGKTFKNLRNPIYIEDELDSITVNPKTGIVYVTGGNDNFTLYTINDNMSKAIVNKIPIPKPNTIEINPHNNKIYLPTNDNGTFVIDGNTTYGIDYNSTTNSFSSYNIAINPTNDKVYELNDDASKVLVINSSNKFGNIITSFTSGNSSDGTFGIAVDANSDLVYTTNPEYNTISMLNGTSGLITQIPVGQFPVSISVNPNTGLVYVANQKSKSVTIINPTTINKEDLTKSIQYMKKSGIEVKRNPSSIAVDSSSNLIYVGNEYSNIVSIIGSVHLTGFNSLL